MFAAAQLRAETTIYVGKHFEVRDHDQPTKYVFSGDTRVARITGSLSTNARIQRFRVRPGWNLLSLAVGATNLSDQLQRPGLITAAHSWNPQTGGYSPVPQVGPPGTVLWVNTASNAIISVLGTYSDPVNRQVQPGATYLASTGLEAWAPSFPSTLAAWSHIRHSSFAIGHFADPWQARLTGDLSSINELPRTFAPGHALYVIANAPYELEVPEPALRIRYYHQDHLGSSSVMTDADGALVEETAFYPFGIPRHEHRLRPIEEAYKFTQKERDRESGLHYFEARYLVGAMSRFLSVDPKYASTESSQGGPQALNLYAYVRNNPLQYTDPTGLDPAEKEKAPPTPLKIGQDALAGATRADNAAAAYNKKLDDLLYHDTVTILTGICDYSLNCGGSISPFQRFNLVKRHNVDTDETGYKLGAAIGTVLTFFIPSPVKAPPAAPGTVTLFAKKPITPIAPMAMTRPPAAPPAPVARPPTPTPPPTPTRGRGFNGQVTSTRGPGENVGTRFGDIFSGEINGPPPNMCPVPAPQYGIGPPTLPILP